MATKRKPKTVDEIKSPASKFGQMIGEAFETVVTELVAEYIATKHSDYKILKAGEGKALLKLEKMSGAKLQLDTVVASRFSDEPVALLESKWLKDGRHHNDKGAWILQLREIKKRISTIRGLVAVLAGYWTEGVGIILMSDAGIRMVQVATDEEIYSILQIPLNSYLGSDSFELTTKQMRDSYPRPKDLLKLLLHLEETGQLQTIARSWLSFSHLAEGVLLTGQDRVMEAVDDLLAPLPDQPKIKSFEIALQIETGNTIYDEFTDIEHALDFIQKHYQNSEQVLGRIAPKKRQ